MAFDMSQSEEPILCDKTVSRMMAERALQDQGFKDMLSTFARSDNNGRWRPKNFNAISTIISDYRDQIADQMGLEAPHTLVGQGPQKLNTYLRHSRVSKDLVSKVAIKEEENIEADPERRDYKWGWVVSYQLCSKILTKLTFDSGTGDVHCTLGFCILTVHAPLSSRPYTFSI